MPACNWASASCKTAIGFASPPTGGGRLRHRKGDVEPIHLQQPLQAERDLGINFWEKESANADSLGVTIAGPDGGKAVSSVYTLDKPGQAVDQRVKYPGWMKKFRARRRTRDPEAGIADLENYARGSDLVILAGGKGDIVKLFERDAERPPFDSPQRALALTSLPAYALRADPRCLQHRADRRRIFRLSVTDRGRAVRDHGARRHSQQHHGLLGRREDAGAALRTQPRYPEEILPLGIRALAQC